MLPFTTGAFTEKKKEKNIFVQIHHDLKDVFLSKAFFHTDFRGLHQHGIEPQAMQLLASLPCVI